MAATTYKATRPIKLGLGGKVILLSIGKIKSFELDDVKNLVECGALVEVEAKTKAPATKAKAANK